MAFYGEALGGRARCEVSREALEDHVGAAGLERSSRLEALKKHRATLERWLREKYLTCPIEDDDAVHLKTPDVEPLRQAMPP